MQITIFGKGTMGKAIAKNFENAGNTVSFLGHEDGAELGQIVVLAVLYAAVDNIIERYKDQLAGKIVIDITNPVDFATFDSLLVPAGTSAAEEFQAKLPQSSVIKAFSTNFSGTLTTGKVGDNEVTVFMASDDDQAKESLAQALQGSPLNVVDAGSLKRARELEAFGFFQMTLGVRQKISSLGGFSLNK